MRQHLPNIALFVVLLAVLAGGFWYIEKTFFPKPEPKPPEPPRETVMALAGGVVHPTKPAVDWKTASVPDVKAPEAPKEQPKPVPVAAPAPKSSPELIELGGKDFYKRVLLTTQGGAIQQVTLMKFDGANPVGLEIRENGQAQPLRIIPGQVPPKVSLTDLHTDPQADRIPGLTPGVVPQNLLATLAEPSYVLLHYPAEDDPKREAKDAGKMNDDYPSPELGERTWTVVEKHTGSDECRVVFETTLGAPYHLKLRKTYTLAAKDYHVGLKLDIIATEERTQRKGKFKYQIAGPRQTHIEGTWYTQVFRNVMIGWQTPSGGAKRQIEDAATIQNMHGGDAVLNGGNTFTYAAVGSQYFASALAIDDTQPKDSRQRMWDSVRATREPGKNDDPNQPFLSDVTFRAVAGTLDPAANETVSHGYLIYDGPAKVRLLAQLGAQVKNRGDCEVSDELVERYLYGLGLRTITDYHSPNFFGRFANAIWWTDLVIVFTNLMHSVLGWFHSISGMWGVAIIMLTVCVRLLLLLPSRKQQIMMVRMQEKMAKMKPEMDKLAEKFKDNPQQLQQEKTRLMLAHGVNPLSTMGGCLLMFAQMPIFMGLYFCLQESVFFRQEGFLWFPNLSAPDMTVWWSESIPWLSTPENLGGAIYLGPFFNILPLLAVALIFIQQKLTMPPPTDEQQEMQQKMMKIMIIVMAVFFYKVAAGLCLYFICSTTWALAERKLIPKPQPVLPTPEGTGPPNEKATDPTANGSGGGIMAKLKAKLEAMKEQADSQSQRQIRNDGTPPRPDRRDKKKKRK